MVSNTTKTPHLHPAAHCLYILYFELGKGGMGGGGEPEERLWAIVHKAGSKIPT
jgi:hypothetical protein